MCSCTTVAYYRGTIVTNGQGIELIVTRAVGSYNFLDFNDKAVQYAFRGLPKEVERKSVLIDVDADPEFDVDKHPAVLAHEIAEWVDSNYIVSSNLDIINSILGWLLANMKDVTCGWVARRERVLSDRFDRAEQRLKAARAERSDIEDGLCPLCTDDFDHCTCAADLAGPITKQQEGIERRRVAREKKEEDTRRLAAFDAAELERDRRADATAAKIDDAGDPNVDAAGDAPPPAGE